MSDEIVNGASIEIAKKTRESKVSRFTISGYSSLPLVYPHSKLQPVSEKFYSKYKDDTSIEESDFEEFVKKITSQPRNKFTDPVLESHEYGWLNRIRFDVAQDYSAILLENLTSKKMST